MFRLINRTDPFVLGLCRKRSTERARRGPAPTALRTPGEVAEIKSQITGAEHEGDEITKAAITRRRNQWITPSTDPTFIP